MKSIFLSHNWNDKPFVRKIGKYLSTYGIKCWIDEAEIKIGESLIDKVGNAIIECDYFGVILSKNSVKSEWVKKELQLALQKEIKLKNVVVLPILIDDVELPPFLWDKLYANFINKDEFETNILKLLDSLGVTEKDILDVRNQSFVWHELTHEIIIKDINGKEASWIKETIATPIRDDIYLWYDEEIHSSGKLTILSTNIGEITKVVEEGGVYTVTTEFEKPLPRKKISKKLEISLENCFIENKETFTWIPIGEFDYLNFRVILPKNRPFINKPRMFAYFGTTKLLLKKCEIKFEPNETYVRIEQPQSGIKYLLEWEW